jgi:hypothetical protein
VDFFNGSAPEGAPGNGLFGGISAIDVGEDKQCGAGVKFLFGFEEQKTGSAEANPVMKRAQPNQ